MWKQIFILALVASVSLASCKRTLHCWAFDPVFFDRWFPYQEGDTRYFSNKDGGRDTLHIRELHHSPAHTVEYMTNGKRKECDIHGTITSQSDTSHPGWLKMYIHYQDDFNKIYNNEVVVVELNNLEVSLKLSGTDIVRVIDHSEPARFTLANHGNIELNGKLYGNTYEITMIDTAALEGIGKIYFSEGQGIVAYRSYPGGRDYFVE